MARSSWYYEPRAEREENLAVMRLLDEQYTRTPFYGVERMAAWLRQQGHALNVKRARRLLRLMGLEAIYPKPRLSVAGSPAKRYPYLLRGLTIGGANHVWSTDITYIRLHAGFLYLVAVLDWYSRYVLSWELSNTLDTGFCLLALEGALRQGQPQIFNTDQGVQFTSQLYTSRLEQAGIQISWDGRGRAGSGGVGRGRAGSGGVGRWTTSSWSGCGARSNGRRSTSKTTRKTTRQWPTRRVAWSGTSASTTMSGRTRR
jgi:putative transposase